MTSEMVAFVGWTSISRLRDGASVAYRVHTPEMVGFDSHSRYTNFNLKLMVPANRFGVIISYNCK